MAGPTGWSWVTGSRYALPYLNARGHHHLATNLHPHVEFAAQIANPIGLKLGPSATPEQAV
jgi:hypothetical protein